ncbi:MAG: sugar phosphate nucleotidyltransferase [Clostridiales bacterium]|nr:sugar phosphate nucleotidyltransferase [Clostridiales bacterium]
MQKTTLVIMAAGLGSRFGGIKQLTPLGPGGEIIMDYSIYDALEAGFDRIVFIIREDIFDDFKEMIGERIAKQADVEYVFQRIDQIPAGFCVPEGRTKPWGTGQAVLTCRQIVDGPFAVINADDYYGKEAFRVVNHFLKQPQENDGMYHFCMAGFQLGNTLSENGTVTRGVCQVSEDGKLTGIEETFEIEKKGSVATALDGAGGQKELPLDSIVSMNMWGFTPELFEELDRAYVEFFRTTSDSENPLKKEFLLPEVIENLLQRKQADVQVLMTHDKWFGVTYQEDRPSVERAFRKLADEGVYPKGILH